MRFLVSGSITNRVLRQNGISAFIHTVAASFCRDSFTRCFRPQASRGS